MRCFDILPANYSGLRSERPQNFKWGSRPVEDIVTDINLRSIQSMEYIYRNGVCLTGNSSYCTGLYYTTFWYSTP